MALASSIVLNHADTVVLAQAHNPSILSPEWVKKYCHVAEEPEKFVHTPEISVFDTEEVQIVLDKARLQVIGKENKRASCDRIAHIISQYVKTLPHIPFTAIGHNYIWLWEGPEASRPQIEVVFSGVTAPSEMEEYGVYCGGILYGTAQDHKMRVLIEVPMPSRVTFNFNFNFDLKGKSPESVAEVAESSKKYMTISERIVNRLLGCGEKR